MRLASVIFNTLASIACITTSLASITAVHAASSAPLSDTDCMVISMQATDMIAETPGYKSADETIVSAFDKIDNDWHFFLGRATAGHNRADFLKALEASSFKVAKMENEDLLESAFACNDLRMSLVTTMTGQ